MKKVHFIPENSYPTSVVGESSYQENIASVIPYIDSQKKRYREQDFSAELILEDDNSFDPGNAVRVELEGQTVGYLSKKDAARYRKGLQKLGLSDVIGVCYAAVSGKREYDFEDMLFGVYLDIDLDDLAVESEMPPQPVNVETPPQPQQPQPTQKKNTKIVLTVIFILMAVCSACLFCTVIASLTA